MAGAFSSLSLSSGLGASSLFSLLVVRSQKEWNFKRAMKQVAQRNKRSVEE
jgi:hypothetical protein